MAGVPANGCPRSRWAATADEPLETRATSRAAGVRITGRRFAGAARSDALELRLERRPVRIERPLGQGLARPKRDGAKDAGRKSDSSGDESFLLALLGPRVQVAGELPFQGPANLAPIGPELSEGLLHFLRQELGWQLLLATGHGPLRPPEDPFGPAQGDERRTRRDAGRLGRRPPNLGRDVDGRATRGFELLEILGKFGPGGYDLRESGIRARAHSIVSFVMSMVR